MEEKALVVRETGEIVSFDRGPISIVEAKKRIEENQKNAIGILEEGTDWVRIPGISKPLLAKPAAEKLSRYAGVVGLPPVQAHYEILEREADPFLEWEFEKKTYEKGRFVGLKTIKTRGFYRYRVRCVLNVIGTEIVVGDKLGCCSSSDPGKETAMENTVLQQAQIRANRQAVMAYIGISDRFTEEEAGDETKRRKEAVGDTKGQPKGKATTNGKIPKSSASAVSKYGTDDKKTKCNFCGKYHTVKGDPIVQHPGPGELAGKWGHANCYAGTFGKVEAEKPQQEDNTGLYDQPEQAPEEPTDSTDPVRQGVIESIEKLENQMEYEVAGFIIDRARIDAFGRTNLNEVTDNALVKYMESLQKRVAK